VAGLPTTWGIPQCRDWAPKEDALGISRLKAAGAVILGKTNVALFLADWQSANPIYGRTSNPWDAARTAGGSSGGGAAAVAAGMVPLEFGSDLSGSIRIPAAFCGIFGHKPSYGLVPLGGFAPPGVDGADIALAVVGPIARTSSDLDLALGVLAGPVEAEATGYRLALPAPRHASLADYRVLIVDQHPNAALDGEIHRALHRLGDRLAAVGAKVARGSELLPDLAETNEILAGMLGAITSRGGPPQPNPMSAHAWMGLLDAQLFVRRRWTAFFRAFDVVLAPVFGTAAFAHDDEREMSKRTLEINGRATPYVDQGAWSGMASLANLPATVAPIDRNAAGMPIGVQIIGPYLEDRTTIGFAGLIEREFGVPAAQGD
jgi:amidase